MTDPARSHPLHPSMKSILKASIAALVVALVILFTAVLPAEYGVDPTGAGGVLGFTKLNATKNQQVTPESYSSEAGKYAQNTVVLKLAPNKGYEYKFRMNLGQALLYSWDATAPLDYEFHGQLEDAPQGEFTSYEKKVGSSANGSLIAPFQGIHGWFWHNKSGNTVTLTLHTAGYYEIKGVVGAPASVIISSE
jgi:hypothetical protein